MIQNPNETMALVVSRSRTVNPPHGDVVLSRVSIRANPTHDIFGVKFDSNLTFADLARGTVSCVSPIIVILRLEKTCGHPCVTSLLSRTYCHIR